MCYAVIDAIGRPRQNFRKNIGTWMLYLATLPQHYPYSTLAELEPTHGFGQVIGLVLELLGGNVGLLHHRGILLSQPVEFGHGDIDLSDTIILFACRHTDLTQYLGDAINTAHQLLHGAARGL